eukprot:5491798-Amphidinium_carterae.1
MEAVQSSSTQVLTAYLKWKSATGALAAQSAGPSPGGAVCSQLPPGRASQTPNRPQMPAKTPH